MTDLTLHEFSGFSQDELERILKEEISKIYGDESYTDQTEKAVIHVFSELPYHRSWIERGKSFPLRILSTISSWICMRRP